MQPIEAFLKKQNDAIQRDFSTASCLIALSPDKLQWMQRCSGWVIEHLPNCLPTSAFVIRRPPNNEPECWARWNYGSYRKAFSSFLKEFYPGFPIKLNQEVQVDHLEPRYRFPAGAEYYVRLHLVRRCVNVAYGAGFERSFFQTERNKDLMGAIHMSWIAYCKARGLLLPSKAGGPAAWDKWARERAIEFSRDTGEPAAHAYAGFLSVLRLGYTGYYSGKPEPLYVERMIREFTANDNSASQLDQSF